MDDRVENGRSAVRDELAGTVCRQDGGTRAYRNVFTACSGKLNPDCVA
jgi:hypothetical protein